MSSIHHFTIKKRWLEAWYALHGLSEFRIMLDEWSSRLYLRKTENNLSNPFILHHLNLSRRRRRR